MAASKDSVMFDEEMTKIYKIVFDQHACEAGPWEAMDRQLSKHLADKQSASILDLATGPGEPGLTMAKRHPEMQVLLSDVSPDMMKQAEARVGEAGLTNAKCALVDAQDMSQFDENTFDAIVSCYGMMFPEDKPKAFSEIYRTLKPNGVFITTYWKKVPFLLIAKSMMEAILGGPAPPPPMNPLALSEEGAIETLLTDAKLKLIETEENGYPFNLGSDEDFAFKVAAAPIMESIKEQEESGNKEALATARSVFDKYVEEFNFRQDSGEIVTPPSVYGLVVAKKEGT